MLDSRKIASVFCQDLIRQKVFHFDEEAAYHLLKQKNSILEGYELNRWITSNILINYKLAYLVSLQILHLTLLNDLLSHNESIKKAKALNSIGHLCKYPREKGIDSFDVNIVIGFSFYILIQGTREISHLPIQFI